MSVRLVGFKALNDSALAVRSASEANFIGRAIAALTDASDLDAFLQSLLENAVSVVGTEHGCVCLLEGEPGHETIHRIVILEAGKPMSSGEKTARSLERGPITPSFRVFMERINASGDGAMSYVDDSLHTEPVRRNLIGAGIEAVYYVALRLGEKMIGWLNVGVLHRRPLDNVALARLRSVADQITIAFAVAHLVERSKLAALAEEQAIAAQRYGDDLVRANRSLKQALDSIESGTSHEASLAQMLGVLADDLRCDSIQLCLRDDDEGAYYGRIAISDGVLQRQVDSAECALKSPGIRSPLWKMLAENLLPLELTPESTLLDSPQLDRWVRARKLVSLLAVPMVAGMDVKGALIFYFGERRDFSDVELEMLQMHAHQLLLTLQLERMSATAEREASIASTLSERTRISCEINESLSQGLSGILMHLHASKRATDPQELRQQRTAALNAARTSLIEARRAVQTLRNPASNQASLATLLRGTLSTTFAGTAVGLNVHIDPVLPVLPLAFENELLMIAQEFATNTLKHARASKFDVRIHCAKNSLIVDMEDDGAGFKVEDIGEGFGMSGMHERAGFMRAELKIVSTKGVGTKATLTAPIRESPPTQEQ